MSYSIVPAQRKAVDYLNYVVAKTKGKLILCGHSKGGNLAAYAAAKAKDEIWNRIQGIYNYDGPGFMDDFLISREYQQICPRYHKYVPSSSMVGVLLGNDAYYTIVESEETGVRQHDPLYWRVLGTEFSRAAHRTRQSYATEHGVRSCIEDLTDEERERIIDHVFEIFREEEMESMDHLRERFRTRHVRDRFLRDHKSLRKDPDIRKLLRGANQSFLTEFARAFFE